MSDQPQPLTAPDLARLDGRDGGRLGEEHTSRASLTIDAVGIHYALVDRGALDDRPERRKIARRKTHGRGQAAPGGCLGIENHFAWIDAVARLQLTPKKSAPLRGFPPVECAPQRLARY